MLGEVRDINKKLGQVNGSLGKFGKAAGGLGRIVAGAFAGAAVVQGVKSIVGAASDAQQSLGATETVFGKFADTVVKSSKKAATQFGLDANTYRENANLLGALFSNQGVAADQLAGATKKMVGVGSDLAATFGGTTTDAVQSLGSAFKGEFDSLEKYGISLNATKISAELAARGQDKLTGAALAAAKQQVTTDLIMAQSSKTRGAFAKENNTLAHQQQVLGAQFTNLKATIGQALLPAFTAITMFINAQVIPALKQWWTVFKTQVLPVILDVAAQVKSALLPVLQQIGTFITGTVVPALVSFVQTLIKYQDIVVPVAAGILAMVAAFKVYKTTMAIVQGVTKAYAAVQAALNVVMAANPIGIVVLALVGLAAAFIIAYKKSETFRNIVDRAFKAVKTVALAVWNAIKGATVATWNAISSAITNPLDTAKAVVSGIVNAIKGLLQNAWNTAKSVTTGAWNGIKTAVSNAINGLMGFIRDIPGRITGALGDLGGLLTGAGKAIIQGLIDGIQSMVGKVTGLLDNLTDKIPFHKGPPEKDKRLLKPAGVAIMQGLVNGMAEGVEGVNKFLDGVTDTIEKKYAKAFADAAKKAEKAYDDAVKAKKKAMEEDGKTDAQISKALDKMAEKHEKAMDRLEKAYDKRAKAAIKSTRDEAKALKDQVALITAKNEELKEQQDILKDLQEQSAAYAKGITDAIVASGDITKAVSSDLNGGPASANDILIDLRSQVADADEYAKLIQSLTQQGLNKTAIQQLIDAGVEGGLATAKALAAGGPDAIAQINALQAQLQTIGENLGTSTAATMYQAGIDIQAGIVAGITDDLGNLEAAATKLAKALVKAIKKALKIKSPSRVMMRLGEYTVAGLEKGLADTRGVVSAAKNLSAAVTTGYTQPRLDNVAMASGGGTQSVSVTLTAQQLDAISRGKAIQMDIDAYRSAGGRSAA